MLSLTLWHEPAQGPSSSDVGAIEAAEGRWWAFPVSPRSTRPLGLHQRPGADPLLRFVRTLVAEENDPRAKSP